MTEREPGVDEGDGNRTVDEQAAAAAGSPVDAAPGTDTAGTEAARQSSSLSGDDLFAVASPSETTGPRSAPAASSVPPSAEPASDAVRSEAPPSDRLVPGAPVSDAPAAATAAGSPVVAMKPGASTASPSPSFAADGSALSGSAAPVSPVDAGEGPVDAGADPGDAEVRAARSESAAAWAGADNSGVDVSGADVSGADVSRADVSRDEVRGADDVRTVDRPADPSPELGAPAPDEAEPARPADAPQKDPSADPARPVAEPARSEPVAEPARSEPTVEPARRELSGPEPADRAVAEPADRAVAEPAGRPAAEAPAVSAAAPTVAPRNWFAEPDAEATAVLPAVRPGSTQADPAHGTGAQVDPTRAAESHGPTASPVDPATVRIPARHTEQQVERPTEVIPAVTADAADGARRGTDRRPDHAGAPTILTKVPSAAAAAGGATAVLGAAAATRSGADAGRTTTAIRAGGTGSGTGTSAGSSGAGRAGPGDPGPGSDATRPVPPEGDSGSDGPDGPDTPGGGSKGRRRRRPLLVAAAVVGLLAVLYVVDLLLGMGDMPRGVSVAGQAVGGMSRQEAEASLRATIDPRATQPVVVTAGDVRTEIDADTAKLGVDWGATIERAGAQPVNPIARIESFFVDKDFDVVSTADERAVTAALEGMGPLVDDEATEASVRFDGLEPVPVMPEDGHRLDVPAAVPLVATKWATGTPVELPLATLKPITTADDVRQAVDSIARPAVSAPITVTGEGAQGTLDPADIAKALTFRADAGATPRLVPELNPEIVSDALSPQLEKTEKPGRDATLDVSGPTPVVVPSQDGRGIDYPATLTTMVPVLKAQAPRQVAAVYGDKPAKVTTEDIEKLGIAGEISTFTTGGFAADSGRNIKRAAEQIDGTIVKPGETFSLNALTNPRNAANGYVEAGIIEDGHPARGIGGGVSQVATTVYNAAYFAGMVDVAHKEHSFYISRYPAAREATVFDNVIDLKFRNDGPTGVLIKTFWTPSSLTVKIYGTKRYEVTSTTGPRTNETPPSPVTIPAGQPCSASSGAPGFTASDTRTLRNVQTGEVRTEKRTVRYNPSPIVVCGG